MKDINFVEVNDAIKNLAALIQEISEDNNLTEEARDAYVNEINSNINRLAYLSMTLNTGQEPQNPYEIQGAAVHYDWRSQPFSSDLNPDKGINL